MYYIKRLTKQDITRTPVISQESVDDFFNVFIPLRDNAEYVKINFTDNRYSFQTQRSVRIQRKQDNRIYLREYFHLLNKEPEEGSLFLYSKKNGEIFLEHIHKSDTRYGQLNSLVIKGNNLIAYKNSFNHNLIERILLGTGRN